MSIKSLISDSLIPDVEKQIISLLDNRALGSFSCTTPYAYKVLVNDGIFKERFVELYKRMHPTPEMLFPHLQVCYPDCCWKVACCLYPNDQPITVFTKEFLETARSPTLVFHNALRAVCGVPSICGMPPSSNSPIHQAWEAYQTACGALLEYHSEHRNDYDEEILRNLEDQKEKCLAYHCDLQNQRSEFERRIVRSSSLDLVNDTLGALLVDQYFTKNPFLITNQLHRLCGMRDMLVSTEGLTFTADVLRQYVFRQFDMRLQGELKSWIFDMLSYQCTGQAAEKDWFENHCHEYVPQLHMIIQRLVSQAERFKVGYFVDLETRIADFFSQNARSFHMDYRPLADTLDSFVEIHKVAANAKSVAEDTIIFDKFVDLMVKELGGLEEPGVVEYIDFLRIYIMGSVEGESVEQMLKRAIEVFHQLILSTNAHQCD